MKHYLQDIIDGNFRGTGSQEPIFAFSHDFGTVSSASVTYTIGSVQQPIMRYLTQDGISPLQPWWTKCYGSIYQMIDFHYNDFAETQRLAYGFESQLKTDVDAYYAADKAMVYSDGTASPPYPYSNGSQGYASGEDTFGDQYIFDPDTAYGFLDPNNFSGIAIPDVSEAESYYSIVALTARQIMGAYVLAVPPASSSNASEPLMFQKEIASDGNVNTVDVMYPAMPFFLYANPELLKYNLEPLFQNQEGSFYPNEYSMHDLGSNFPNATGHVEGNDEYMVRSQLPSFLATPTNAVPARRGVRQHDSHELRLLQIQQQRCLAESALQAPPPVCYLPHQLLPDSRHPAQHRRLCRPAPKPDQPCHQGNRGLAGHFQHCPSRRAGIRRAELFSHGLGLL